MHCIKTTSPIWNTCFSYFCSAEVYCFKKCFLQNNLLPSETVFLCSIFKYRYSKKNCFCLFPKIMLHFISWFAIYFAQFLTIITVCNNLGTPFFPDLQSYIYSLLSDIVTWMYQEFDKNKCLIFHSTAVQLLVFPLFPNVNSQDSRPE